MFSQAVEYSLRAMVMLTASMKEPLTVHAMAERGQIPAPYLAKLLQGLTRAGLVVSQRGIGGGYILNRDPADISLADIVHVISPMKRTVEPPAENAISAALGPLHQKLDQTLATIETSFQKTSLEDLRRDNFGLFPLCGSQPIVNLEFDANQHPQSP